MSLPLRSMATMLAPDVSRRSQFLERLADERRPVRHANPVLAVRESVFLDPVGKARAVGTSSSSLVVGGQPAAGEDHVDDAQDQDRHAERREAEEVKALRSPWRSSSLLTTRFGAVATSVIMPLISAAKLSGIISRLGACRCSARCAAPPG